MTAACLVAVTLPVLAGGWTAHTAPTGTALRFEVSVAAGLLIRPQDGRLLIVMSTKDTPEPRRQLGPTGMQAPPTLGHDVDQFGTGKTAVVDESAVAFPIADLAHLPAGDYSVQAIFDWNPNLRMSSNPRFPAIAGTLYSEPRRMHLDPAHGETVRLELTQKVPEETLPANTGRHRYLKVKSEKLSAFHGRPIYVRAGVRLPADFDSEPTRRYPLRVHIGGYGSRYSVFPREDKAGDAMVVLVTDGDGPLGDPYQVNSDNNGPYGDTLTQELIPYVEAHFRCIGKPFARVLDGGSTGGWVSLALQVFYPDFFNGTWSSCPDPVDFRDFQLVNIYADVNAYTNKYGFERPGMRTVDGDTQETMRHECQIENLLGRGDSWTMSGGQWGAWNAVYGPRGPDGRPVPLWDPKTGAINHEAAEHWKRYDLRMVLEQNWATLGPRLQGKIHIWIGDADNYFLNNAVHRLDQFLTKAQPPYQGLIEYGPQQGHCWRKISEKQMIEQMLEAVHRGAKAESTHE
jgi:hypothetical protein